MIMTILILMYNHCWPLLVDQSHFKGTYISLCPLAQKSPQVNEQFWKLTYFTLYIFVSVFFSPAVSARQLHNNQQSLNVRFSHSWRTYWRKQVIKCWCSVLKVYFGERIDGAGGDTTARKPSNSTMPQKWSRES